MPSVELLNPLDDPRWDEHLAACPGATFFHTTAWARVLRDTYGFRPVYIVRTGADGSRDILPMMEVETWATPRRGVSLPFTDACAPLCATRAAADELFSSLQSHACQRGWKSWELRGGREWLHSANPSTSYYTHSLNLRPGGEEALFWRASSATRRAVRKAQNSGLTVQFSQTREAMCEFFRLQCRTRHRLGVPPQPPGFFAKIHQHIVSRCNGSIVLAFRGDLAVAGAVYFHNGETVHYKFGASDDRFQQYRGNNLVMWSAIERYAKLGYATLDLGRTSLANEGLRQFKLSWGAAEQRLEYVKYDCRRGAFVTHPDRAIEGLHSRLTRMLPLPVLRLAGRILYRHAA